MESSWRPASAEERFEIVRRRLFQPIETDRLADRDATARAFGEFYRSQKDEFPARCREPAYADRIKHAYPVHPRNLEDAWKPIIDVDGDDSLPRALDDEFKNLGRYLATRRGARTTGVVGTDAGVTIEISADNDDGFPDQVVRVVTENASALRFTQHGFEQK